MDLRPFSVVDNIGFKNMIKCLEPRYDLPSKTHFSTVVVPEIYREEKANLTAELKNANAVALTSDGWTSRATESYITVTAHYIDIDWEMRNVVLQTRQLNESHTAENEARVLTDAVKVWDLKRVFNPAITTDNASNVVNAVKIAELFPHIRCFAHTINLAAQKGLRVSQVDKLLGKLRAVVGFFHRSSVAYSKFKSNQLLLQQPAHKLIQDVKTRWNSSYDMIRSYVEQQPAIMATFMDKTVRNNGKGMITLTDQDISYCEDLMSVLKSLKTVTTLLCDEKMPTVSLIHPLKEMLLAQMAPLDTDSGMMKSVKEAVRENLAPR